MSASATAPMQRKPPRRGKVPCGVCQGAIVDGKDEALLCEGKCGLWFHRGCASIPPYRYKELSSSEEPFICLSCTNLELKREILLLKNELKGMAEVRDRCSALAAEVSSLRDAIDSLKGAKLSTQPPLSAGHPKRSYARIARTHQFPHPAATNKKTKRAEASLLPSKSDTLGGPSENRRANSTQSRPKTKVDGARRIWNTVPTCSAKAIASTISKLVPTKLDLRVKRKTKSILNNSKTVWWFVVHGSESDLIILDREWDKVHQHTLWSLQNCYMSPNGTLPSAESDLNAPTANTHSDPSPATISNSEFDSSGQQPFISDNEPAVSKSTPVSPLVNENSPSHDSSFLEQDPPRFPPQQSSTPPHK